MTTVSFSTKSLESVAPALAKRLERGQETAEQLLDRLTQDVLTDTIGAFGPEHQDDNNRLSVGYDDKADDVLISVGEGDWMTFHPNAISQLGDRLKINGSMVRKQLQGAPWQREAIADFVTTHLSNTPLHERFLVRSVKGEVRGILSDSFRRLSSPLIAETFQEGLQRLGVVPYDVTLTDLKWRVRAMLPRPIEVHSKHHGTEFVGIGLSLSNSDFGVGSLDLQAEILRLLCVNGMVGDSQLRAVHLGGRLPSEIQFAEDTYRKDTEVQCLALRDMLPHLVSQTFVEKSLAPLQGAMDQTVNAQEAVKGLVRATRVNRAQAERLELLLMNRDGTVVPEGPVTRWSVAQAVSALANDTEIGIDEAAILRSTATDVITGRLGSN